MAREFTRLTSGRKLYRRRTEPPVGGRERVYAIPTAAAAKPIRERVLGRASLFGWNKYAVFCFAVHRLSTAHALVRAARFSLEATALARGDRGRGDHPPGATRSDEQLGQSHIRIIVLSGYLFHQCFEQLLPKRPDRLALVLGTASSSARASAHWPSATSSSTHRSKPAGWLSISIVNTAALAWEEAARRLPRRYRHQSCIPSWSTCCGRSNQPVHDRYAARQAPLRYLADVEHGMSRRLGADPSYAGVIVKNPLSSRGGKRLAPFA